MGLAAQAAHLRRDADGLWTAPQATAVSYPASGHDDCMLLEDASFWFRHRNQCIIDLVCKYPPAGPILDVGGGNGFVTRGLIDAGFPSCLLEPGRVGALNGLRHRNLPEVLCSTLQEAGFGAASIPAMGIFDVLEHIPDRRRFLSDLHTRLVPGGMLYGTVPAHPGLWSASDDEAGHVCRFTRSGLLRALSSHFDVVRLAPIFTVLMPLQWALRSLPYAVGLSRARANASYAHEHGTQAGITHHLLSRALAYELQRLRAGDLAPWGASFLFAARAKRTRLNHGRIEK